MNKAIKYVLSVAVGLASLTSCDTYGDPQIEESAIGTVMSGYWIGNTLTDITDANNPVVLIDPVSFAHNEYQIQTYATANQDLDKMWIYFHNIKLGLRGKLNIDQKTYSILPTDGVSNLTNTPAYKVIEGRVIKDGFTTLSGGKSDQLELIYQLATTEAQGKTLKLVAWRDSLWPQDYL